MAKKNAVIMMYVIVGFFIGLIAFRHYTNTVGENVFYAMLCIAMVLGICIYFAKITCSSIGISAVALVVMVLLRNPISWAIVWCISAVQVVLNIIWGILSLIVGFFAMFF